MSHRTLCKGAEAACPTTTGTATSFSSATVVRLVNTHTSAHLVTVVETQSGDVVGKFTVPPTSAGQAGVDIIDKEYNECIFASGANVKGVKVGFVGY